VVLEVVHLYGAIGEVHDDGLGCPDPPFDLGYGGGGRGPDGVAPAALTPLPSLSQVLIHVLSEVSEESELLMERGGDLVSSQTSHSVALSKLHKRPIS